MTVSDFKEKLSTFTASELNEILDATRYEIARRDKERREQLKRNFFKAWNDLEEDGATIYFDGDGMCLEDVEIE